MIDIPPATKSNRRDLGSGISTRLLLPRDGGIAHEQHGGTTGWVVATYACTRRYASPVDAPVFARMAYERARPGVDMRPGWLGEVVLQTYSDREDTALRELLDTLRMTGLDRTMPPAEWARLESIVHDLAHTTLSTPWEQRPMPRAGNKPRRRRLRWTDPDRPKGAPRVNVYADTLQRRADLPPRTNTTTQEDHDPQEIPTNPIHTAPSDDPVH